MPGPAVPFLVFACCMIAIWLLSGGGYFWPVWPLMGWGIPLYLGLRVARSCGSRGGYRN